MGAIKAENRVDTYQRRRFVLERRKAGMTFLEIATAAVEKFGEDRLPETWGKRYAHKDLMRALKNAKTDLEASAETMLQMELERLNEMQRRLWTKVLQGEESAVDRVLKIMQRRAKYLGLDSPDEIRARMDVGLDTLLPQLMEALSAYPEARAAAAEALAGEEGL